MEGWYYLHTNGDLIYKREFGDTAADIRKSNFARAMWPVDPGDRCDAWRILVEGLAAGADRQRIISMANKWGCDDDDAKIYADRIGCNLTRDGNSWCATRRDFVDLQSSPAGFGDTCLEAMAVLCRELGYRPSKMWDAGFSDLLEVRHG